MIQQLTTEQKKKIAEAVKGAAPNFPGGAQKHAISLGLNPSIYSRLLKGETEKIIRESDWVRIGRSLNVNLGNKPEWRVATTATYKYITAQLNYCQKNGTARILCDRAGIGKTFIAKEYARTHANVVYIDCSQVKTKKSFIRALAKAFGVDNTGRVADVQADLIYYVNSLESPLIILDETGDLDYTAWLELKALWNAMEFSCGWYMMGADGLRAKMDRHISNRKVGYAEIFRRFGSEYKSVFPENDAEAALFMRAECKIVADLNMPGVPLKELLPEKKQRFNVFDVYESIMKHKRRKAA